MDQEASFLLALNEEQLRAATHNPSSTLQILAGPGSGKTRVLTSRIAHLILNCHIPPSAICAVTFTNKAANEMRERLTKLLGKTRVSQLKMGTFHSLCARFLRKFAKLVDIPDNFTVCDAGESKKIITALLKTREKDLKARGLTLEPGQCASLISKAKSRCLSAEDYLEEAKAHMHSKTSSPDIPSSLETVVGEVYVQYEATLRRNSALDFDDLLIYGVKLFSGHPLTVSWCQHILVDEFQDTNITQYELMRSIAESARCITIVGDPDQSIYGWRAAEVENLAKMRRDFPNTAQVFLEENYRSTASILDASLEIVSQDTKRINKSLYTAHPDGISPVLYQVQKEQEEAAFIAIEIKRLVAQMGGSFRWGDFAILLRYNALSRNLESALQREGIPHRILGGHRFFERLEVKDVLAYLQLVDNPAFSPAFLRVINVPGRGIGEKTLLEIQQRAEKAEKSPLQLLEGIFDMRLPDNKPSIRKKITTFVQVMRKLQKSAKEGMGPSDLISQLLDLVQYEDHLRKTQPDWETRWENVKELITFAKEVEEQNLRDAATREASADVSSLDVEMSPLRQFLQVSMLSSAGDNDTEESSQDKVTITTCHSAKGLEWPVVMIPSVDASTYPFIRSEDEDEERRLLYVACTRAKALLYLTRSTTRMVAGDQKTRGLSKFIQAIMENCATQNKMPLFRQHVPHLELEDRAIICNVLQRPEPVESEVEGMVEGFRRLGREHPPQILWTPAGQPLNPVQATWPFAPSLAHAASASNPIHSLPLPTFGRPVVPHLARSSATSARSIAPCDESRSSALPSYREPTTQPLPPVTVVPASSFSSHTLRKEPSPASFQPASSRPSKPIFSSTEETSTHMTNAARSGTRTPQSKRAFDLAVARPPVAQDRSKVFQPSGNASISRRPLTGQLPTPPLVKDNSTPKPLAAPTPPPPSTNTVAATAPQGVKRRLGMAPRAAGGYSNKKFKAPTL